MESRSKPQSTPRREFLQGVALAGGAGILASISAAPLSQATSPATSAVPDRTPQGTYHLTEHIRDYYRSLR